MTSEADPNPDRPLEPVEPGFLEQQRPCSYLPQEIASLEYRVALALTAERYARLLPRGWRRHGMMLFRPHCPACAQCRSLRVPVRGFRPSKSQRRIANRNRDLEVRLAPAQVTVAHVALYNAYHADMHERRGWPLQQATPEEYAQAFLTVPSSFAFELQYRLGGRLVAVGLIDVLPIGLSSIYFYHDPRLRSAGLGTASILHEIEFCRREGLEHLYLGYWIEACPSMSYKAGFRPHEVLERTVDENEQPHWLAAAWGR